MRWSAIILPLLIACGDDRTLDSVSVAFDQTPAAVTNQEELTFTFAMEGEVSRLTCSLDSSRPVDCRSPFVVKNMAEGDHTLTVTATSPSLATSSATFSWKVDRTAPETQLTLAPPALHAETNTTVMFAAAEGDGDIARFECSLDGEAFAACTSPLALVVEDGRHTFEARATDKAGNVDWSPAKATWEVDTSAPLVSFTAGPIGPVASTTPVFEFVVPGVTTSIQCQLDGAAFAACTSPVTTPELAQGSHLFTVRAVDLAGNIGMVSRTFLVDTVGPSLTITSGPTNEADSTPTWTFQADSTAATIECRIDVTAWARCDAGTFTAAPLPDGEHAFEVRAADALGNLGSERRTFTIDTSTCGDGVIDPTLDEVCDGENLGGATCESVGDFDGGTLACNATCGFDTSGCRKCGNGVIESPETCDGGNFGGATCQSMGFTAGELACSNTCGIDTSGCGVCGDGTAQNPEVCDGDDLRGATCQSIGEGGGTLACLTGCGGYDISGCTGGDGYVPANSGFTGKPCFDGLRYSTPALAAPYVLACTEENGIFRTAAEDRLAINWTSGSAIGATSLRGRVVATNPQGPPIYYISDPSTASNAFRSSNHGGSWVAQSINNAGMARDIFSFIFRQQIGNIAGSWDAAMGAVVLHGAAPNLVPHHVGPTPGSVTGTVRGIASGGPKDVYVAVHGQTPSGEPATGGIYRSCDLTQTGGGVYEARHTGIADDDLNRVWSITVDPSSIVSSTFQCAGVSVSGYANTYYAALRGGGQIYKTTDGGASWTQRNTGLPAGAEVHVIAVHCFSGTAAPNCQDPNLLYAATSAGLYRSTDAGATWSLDGFEGKSVRAVTIEPTANPPLVFVGVDDEVGIYRSL